MNSDLSVVIPTYRRKDSLFRLISCLNGQIDVKLEIIVVDQNHDDFFSSEELLNFETTKKIKQTTPNVSLARNNGFLSAASKYILFLDDDLVPEPNFCHHALNIFKAYPEVRCFSPNVYSNLGTEKTAQNIRKLFTGETLGSSLISISETISAAIFFERNYYFKSGGFDPYLFDFAKAAEDQEFFIRMKNKSMILWYALDLNIFHDENQTGGCELRSQSYWITRRKCIMSRALRYRIHGSRKGKLTFLDIYHLLRSAILNRVALSNGLIYCFWNLIYLMDALNKSKNYYNNNKINYESNQSFLSKKSFLVE